MHKVSPTHITLVTPKQEVRKHRQQGEKIGYQIILEPIKTGIFETPAHQAPLSNRKYNAHRYLIEPSREEVLQSYTTHDISNVKAPYVDLSKHKIRLWHAYSKKTIPEPNSMWVQAHKEYVVAMVVDIREPNGSPLATSYWGVNDHDRELLKWLELPKYACPSVLERMDDNLYMQKFVGKLVLVLPELPLTPSGRICLYSLNGKKIDPLIGKNTFDEMWTSGHKDVQYELADSHKTNEYMWQFILSKTPKISMWNMTHSREISAKRSHERDTREARVDEEWPLHVTPVYVLKQNVQ